MIAESLEVTESQWDEMFRRTAAEVPSRLPYGWRDTSPGAESPLFGMRCFTHTDGRHVILTAGKHEGRWWLHVSVTVPRRVPFYAELADVKDLFIGRGRQAIQVFPRRSEHVNIHERCLHLWCCLEPEGDGLPAFGRLGTI